MKLDYCFTPDTKINSKWIRDLNVKSEAIKYIKGNIGNKLLNTGLSEFDSKHKETKINKWDNIKWNYSKRNKNAVNQLWKDICK